MGHSEKNLTVAVTGPTGTFGSGLLPLLEADDRVARVAGVARRPFDPAARGWTKMDYRRGDVRDPRALREAFRGADVVVHLAFLITGAAPRRDIQAINMEGTLNAFRAAAGAGARRFVYASSVAAYGFHADNPVGMTEDWPVRPAARLFYARQKAELENLLQEEATANPGLGLYLLRPSIVVGPDTVGGKQFLPGPLAWMGDRLVRGAGRPLPVPAIVAVPDVRLQLVHERDVGDALRLCIVAAGPAGPYNIAADGTVTAADIARELGLWPVSVPAAPGQALARALAGLPFLPPFAEWVEAASHPAIMNTARARERLGWSPRFTALQALRDTLKPGTILNG